jgi:hypothetical protein
MVQLLKAAKVVTKQGECDINIKLDLNISLNTDDLKIAVQAEQTKAKAQEDEIDEFEWAIPDFENSDFEESGMDFGKEVKIKE